MKSRITVTVAMSVYHFKVECRDYFARCCHWSSGRIYCELAAFLSWSWSELCAQIVKNVLGWSSSKPGVRQVPLPRGSAGGLGVVCIAVQVMPLCITYVPCSLRLCWFQ